MAITGLPVVVVPSGGLPVTVSATGMGLLMSPASTGLPVTIVGNYGVAVVGLGGSDTPPNYAMLALPGSFQLTGEGMTPIAEQVMSVGMGAFALTDPGTTQLTPPITLALDPAAAAVNHTTSGTTIATTLTCTKANNVIVVFVMMNAGGAIAVSGIADTGGLTWYKIIDHSPGSANPNEIWFAKASGIYSGTITATFSTATNFANLVTFGVNGSDASWPFDPVISILALTGGNFSFNTINSNDMLIATYRAGVANDTAGSGWTLINGAQFGTSEYMIVSAPQSGTVATVGNAGNTQGLGLVITASPQPSPTYWNTYFSSTNTVLSGGNLVVTSSAGGGCSIRAATCHSTGKYFFSAVYGGAFGNQGIGVSNVVCDIKTDTFGGNDNNSAALYASGTIYINNSGSGGPGAAVNPGDVVDVAVDLTGSPRKIWVRINNGSWSDGGNSTLTTGGVSLAALGTGALFPSAWLPNASTSWTANFGPTYTYPPPALFGNW